MRSPGPPSGGVTVEPAAAGVATQAAEHPSEATPGNADLVVVTTDDRGPGSLRQAILDANARPGPDIITFDPEAFAEPQTINLDSELPEITGVLTIDGFIPNRLWKATGVTVSGSGRVGVLRVSETAHLTLRNVTVADGCAEAGGGVTNLGALVVSGVTLRGNRSASLGAAILNLGGAAEVINSTFADNAAGEAGGGIADVGGLATVTNCTFSGNAAEQGAAVFSDGELLLRNTILVDGVGGADCVAAHLHPASTHNLIGEGSGCGPSIVEKNPDLEALGRYNGPTEIFPLGGGSPAINLGDNASAVDENGRPLVWDQRGNGDPRFVAGFTDIGAFEHQRYPYLMVDTVEDGGLRACTRVASGDCSLRGAIELANATPQPDVVTFDAAVFKGPTVLRLERPLPEITAPLTLDAGEPGRVVVTASGGSPPFEAAPGVDLTLVGVTVTAGAAATPAGGSERPEP